MVRIGSERSPTQDAMRLPGAQPDEAFHARRLSIFTGIRLLLWLLLAASGFGVMVSAGLGDGARVIMVLLAVLLAVLFFAERAVARDSPLRRPLLVLSRRGIVSRAFAGRAHGLDWHDIAWARMESVGSTVMLVVNLKAAALHRYRNGSLWPRNRIRKMSVSALSLADKDQLAASIARRLLVASAEVGDAADDREFLRGIEALAPRPWVTWALIAINVLVFGTMLVKGGKVTGMSTGLLMAWGANHVYAVQGGEWWRLFSAMFLHLDIKHLAVNMVMLYVLGGEVERRVGGLPFLQVYLVSGLMGNALSLHVLSQAGVSVGASGAVFGVAAARFTMAARHLRRLPEAERDQLLGQAGMVVAYALCTGFTSTGTDHAAHLGGLLGGAMLATCLRTRLDKAAYQSNRRTSMAAAIITGCMALGLVTATAPRASAGLSDPLAGAARFESALAELERTMKAMAQDNEDKAMGKLTDAEVSRRAVEIYAPVFDGVVSDLVRVTLPLSDPRAPILQDLILIADLLREATAMPDVRDSSTGELVPKDPVRMKTIEADVKRLLAKLEQRKAALTRKALPGRPGM
jgi:rhomboid protease GluP